MTAQDHHVFIQPANLDIPIWRYMDFTKFVSMLDHQGLFFSRADLLGDPFEGAIPRPTFEHREQILKSIVSTVPPETQQKLKRDIEQANNISNWSLITQKLRSWTYISCWHMSEYESAAMWKLYSYSSEAICIKSTYKVLRNTLPTSCFFGIVNYIDYEKDMMPFNNILWPYVYKRKSFAHEQEARAIIFDLESFSNPTKQQTDSGIWQNLNLEAIVQQVYIAPSAPVWFKELIESTLNRFKYNFAVQQSTLDAKPLW